MSPRTATPARPLDGAGASRAATPTATATAPRAAPGDASAGTATAPRAAPARRPFAPPAETEPARPFAVHDACDDPRLLAGYHRLRRRAFVEQQGLFAGHDLDLHDEGAETVVLVAVDAAGEVAGGVRLHPHPEHPGLGWWNGSRLVCNVQLGVRRGAVGAALVRAACAVALKRGALRFDAQVQARHERFFCKLGWERTGATEIGGKPHVAMRWPIPRFTQLVDRTKQPLGALLDGLLPHDRWRGDDGAPVFGTDVVACTDAILPSMVEHDPEWAGWCAMLVNAHDLSAMGATPVAALDALGARDAAHAERVLAGLRDGARAFDLPIVGGHTQLGVAPSLSVTALGRATDPVPAGGGRPGDTLAITADVDGAWRPGYEGLQWDSTSWRTRDELRPMLDAVRDARPRAAKDVSIAGIVGTTAMLAEASGCGAELDVAMIPRPSSAAIGDWLTCFPGFAVVTAGAPLRAGAAVSAICGRLGEGTGVRLRWPDGEITTALGTAATGLGPASNEENR
jgi:putative N-acetyltransferase (TIGR04045 family)